MTPEQIAVTYDKLAAFWDGPEFNRRHGIAQHERAIRFVTKPGLALDLGCGCSGRIIDLLQKRGFEVEGLDISREMLWRAHRRHPRVHFHAANLCTWEFPKKYDFISAWDSLWHVPLSQQKAVVQKICANLNSGGVFIFTTGGVDVADERVNPCQGHPLYHAAMGVPDTLRLLVENGCTLRHLEYDQLPEVHVYMVAQRT